MNAHQDDAENAIADHEMSTEAFQQTSARSYDMGGGKAPRPSSWSAVAYDLIFKKYFPLLVISLFASGLALWCDYQVHFLRLETAKSELVLQQDHHLNHAENSTFTQLDKITREPLSPIFFESHPACLDRALTTASSRLPDLELQSSNIRTRIVDWSEDVCGGLSFAPALSKPRLRHVIMRHWQAINTDSYDSVSTAYNVTKEVARLFTEYTTWLWPSKVGEETSPILSKAHVKKATEPAPERTKVSTHSQKVNKTMPQDNRKKRLDGILFPKPPPHTRRVHWIFPFRHEPHYERTIKMTHWLPDLTDGEGVLDYKSSVPDFVIRCRQYEACRVIDTLSDVAALANPSNLSTDSIGGFEGEISALESYLWGRNISYWLVTILVHLLANLQLVLYWVMLADEDLCEQYLNYPLTNETVFDLSSMLSMVGLVIKWLTVPLMHLLICLVDLKKERLLPMQAGDEAMMIGAGTVLKSLGMACMLIWVDCVDRADFSDILQALKDLLLVRPPSDPVADADVGHSLPKSEDGGHQEDLNEAEVSRFTEEAQCKILKNIQEQVEATEDGLDEEEEEGDGEKPGMHSAVRDAESDVLFDSADTVLLECEADDPLLEGEPDLMIDDYFWLK